MDRRLATYALSVAFYSLLVLAVSGCGGSKVVTVTQRSQTRVETSGNGGTSTGVTTGNCNDLGINREVGNEGTCTQNGVRYHIVNRAHTLRLTLGSGWSSCIRIRALTSRRMD